MEKPARVKYGACYTDPNLWTTASWKIQTNSNIELCVVGWRSTQRTLSPTSPHRNKVKAPEGWRKVLATDFIEKRVYSLNACASFLCQGGLGSNKKKIRRDMLIRWLRYLSNTWCQYVSKDEKLEKEFPVHSLGGRGRGLRSVTWHPRGFPHSPEVVSAPGEEGCPVGEALSVLVTVRPYTTFLRPLHGDHWHLHQLDRRLVVL